MHRICVIFLLLALIASLFAYDTIPTEYGRMAQILFEIFLVGGLSTFFAAIAIERERDKAWSRMGPRKQKLAIVESGDLQVRE